VPVKIVKNNANFLANAHKTKYNIVMQQLQAYKFEIMPIGEQERNMRRYAGACRFVFNKALACQIDAYASESRLNDIR
jgi:predicted transcriptional regulator